MQTATRTLPWMILIASLAGGCGWLWPKYNPCHEGKCDDAAPGSPDLVAAVDRGTDGDAVAESGAADLDASRGDQALLPPSWATAAGSACPSLDSGAASCSDRGYGVAVDGKGNVFVAGSLEGSAVFGSLTLTAAGSSDLFVAKLDALGKLSWVVAAGGKAAGSKAAGVAVDKAGDVYITGQFGGSVAFGSTTLTAKKGNDAFVARVKRTDGSFVWATAMGCDNGVGRAVAMGPAGDPHVTGYFSGSCLFGQTQPKKAQNNDVYVARLDAAKGSFAWVAQGGGATDDRGHAIAVESKGYAYITGQFGKTASFGTFDVNSQSLVDVYVAKLHPKGTFEWAYGTGKAGMAEGTGVVVDAQGSAYITGYFTKTTQFGSTTLTARGNHDLFVWKVKSTP